MPKTCDDCVNAYMCSLAGRDMTATGCEGYMTLDEHLANIAKAIRELKSVRDLVAAVRRKRKRRSEDDGTRN